MATILTKDDFTDPDIRKQLDVDGSEGTGDDNNYLTAGDVEYKFLYRTSGVAEADLLTPVDSMVKQVMAYSVSCLVCVSQIKEIAGALNGNVNPNFEKWNEKYKIFKDLYAQYKALLTKQDFMTEEAIENEDLDGENTNMRFTNARAS